MTSDNPPPQAAGSRRGFWMVFLFFAFAAALFANWIKHSLQKSHGGLSAGKAAPKLNAEGWLNGQAPTETPKAGTIRVVYAWFTTCPACYRESSLLVKLHKQYHDQGVEFVGLTYESQKLLPDIKQFLDQTGITWINGYGALDTLQQYGVEYFPSIWIIDAQGQILWSMDSREPLEEAIPLALAGKLTPQAKP